MKRLMYFVLAVLCFCCVSCEGATENILSDLENEISTTEESLFGYPVAENTCPYALMYDGVTYYHTGEYLFEDIEVSDKDILGSVTSVIPESGMPQEDGQANIPIEGSVFIKHELADDGLLVLIRDKWYIFEIRD